MQAKAGKSIEEVAKFVEDNHLKLCHWFTVDDLHFLKRGGRISAATAVVGSMLSIKPILHVDDEGHLVNVTKVRGRRNAVSALADKFGELALEKSTDEIFISHADCMQDAEYLAGLLKDRYGATVKLITDVGPVIGAHSGPGTLALFFFGKNR
jgi:DegV family protein with EDD domain